LRVSIPATMSRSDEKHWVDEMLRRVNRERATANVDLEARARSLARRYGLPAARSIRWVDNQRWRWGSCTPSDGSVRVSSRLAGYPDWVVDYVVVHELAHLRHPGHDAAFWSAVDRYPRSELAKGYLIAKGEEADA
jgi:predicted metal-dependent hydrolase